MKSSKLSPEAVTHGGQIATLLQSTVASAGQTSDPARKEAAAWWKEVLAGIVAKHFKQEER